MHARGGNKHMRKNKARVSTARLVFFLFFFCPRTTPATQDSLTTKFNLTSVAAMPTPPPLPSHPSSVCIYLTQGAAPQSVIAGSVVHEV